MPYAEANKTLVTIIQDVGGVNYLGTMRQAIRDALPAACQPDLYTNQTVQNLPKGSHLAYVWLRNVEDVTTNKDRVRAKKAIVKADPRSLGTPVTQIDNIDGLNWKVAGFVGAKLRRSPGIA